MQFGLHVWLHRMGTSLALLIACTLWPLPRPLSRRRIGMKDQPIRSPKSLGLQECVRRGGDLVWVFLLTVGFAW